MTVAATTVEQFIQLFRGRGDAYGSWDGGCVREPLTPTLFVSHLSGDTQIGVYTSVPTQAGPQCVWGCTDIDYDDYDEAALLRATFASIGIVSWVEKTRKGYHIWVFATGLVPSQDMRYLQLAAHQVAGTNPKEVNPKQLNVSANLLGNYVRLPYPHGTDQRRMLDNEGVTMSLEAFADQAFHSRNSPELIAEFASYYVPPATVQVDVGAPTADMTAAAQMLTPLGKVIWRDGPLEGRDRSTTLQHLCHESHKAQLQPADALMLLKDADQRWGKYSTRGEAGQTELLKLVQRAYGITLST